MEMQLTDLRVKACPQCAENVKAEANVCRHCGHDFDWQQARTAGIRKTLLGLSIGAILAAVFFRDLYADLFRSLIG